MERFTKLIEDIHKNGNNTIFDFVKYDSLYLLTTENINGYMEDLTNKNVLSVVGSGDQYLNALTNNASSVDLFDINAFSIFMLKLKIGAIKNIDYETYLKYFGIINDNILDYHIYEYFSKYLDYTTKFFWDTNYKLSDNDGNNLYNTSRLFHNLYKNNFNRMQKINSYLASEDNYNELRNRLNNISNDITFYNTDLSDLTNVIKNNYDVIYLSNIQDYQSYHHFLATTIMLSNYLNKDGIIYFAYLYYNAPTIFYDEYIKLIDDDKVCCKNVASMNNTDNFDKRYDQVLYLKNKLHI